MSFISELRNRHVFRAAFAYMVVSWLLVQVADLLLEAFAVPPWVFRSFIVLLAIGFPVALILSWFFEMTTAGLVRSADLPKMEAELNAFRRYLNPIIISMLSAAVILFAIDKFGWINGPMEETPAIASKQHYSVAVLPFVNRSGYAESAYFVDGIHDDLLTMLAKIKALSVTSRTSVMRYRDSTKSIPEISAELGVNYILEGGVQRDGDQIRVNAQLIDTRHDDHVWAETFDRELSTESVFAIQSSIARAIAAALNAELTSSDEHILDDIPTESLAAYDSYLLGRQGLLGFSPESYEAAVEHFETAIALDQSFAGAYAGLCQAHLGLYQYSSNIGYFNTAQTACDEALKIEADRTEVHIALGTLYRHHGDYQQAEDEQRQALASEPQNVEAMIELGTALALQNKLREAEKTFLQAEKLQPEHWPVHDALFGFYRQNDDQPKRYELAVKHALRVVELNPKNASAWNNLGTAYHSLQQFDAAEAAWDRVLELEPTRSAYTNRGLQYFYEGRYADSAEMQTKAIELAPDDHRAWGRLAESYRAMGGNWEKQNAAYLTAIDLAEHMLQINDQDWRTSGMLATYYANTGQHEKAKTIAAASLENSTRNPEALLYAALVYLATGEQELTLSTLEEMVERDDSYRNYAVQEPDFKALKGNERFDRLVTTEQ